MKYKIGDKVKVLSIDDSNEYEEKRFLNKIKTIVDIWEDNTEGYIYGLENENWANLYFKEEQLQDMRRDYAIVCMRHKGILDGALLFWGSKTEDSEKRSMSGYTSDIDNCEKFTLDEVISEGFEVIDSSANGIPKYGDFAVKIDELFKFGFKKITIIC